MTTTIWILKTVIALIFTFTGVSKMFLPKPKLLAKGMKGLKDLDEDLIKLVGLLEVLGVLGLILPTLLCTYSFLSGISAIYLSLTMIIAGWINHKHKLSIIPNIVLFIICILIACLELKYF